MANAEQLKHIIEGTLSLHTETRKAGTFLWVRADFQSCEYRAAASLQYCTYYPSARSNHWQLTLFVASFPSTAEASLTEAQKSPGFPTEVLKIVASSDGTDLALRQAAAVHFKNAIKMGWDVNREDGNEGIVITENDRSLIKSHLVQLMCTVPPKIQAMLSESISLIAEVDYPKNWANLLPELVQQFNSADPTVVVGVLKTANSIFKPFRHVERTDALYEVIIYTLNIIAAPLMALFKQLGQAVQSLANDKAQLLPRMEALCLICRIVYSLNFQDLPEFFEDHMADWLADYKIYLTYQNPLLTDADEEEQPSPIDKLQAAIIDILSLYTGKDEECFMGFLPEFTKLVWILLMNVTYHKKHDVLATKSIKFLSSLLEKEMHKQLFQNQSTLREIVLKIVIPNLTFRQSDEERFEDDPREFIVTEVEGSDSESRRKCSQVLLRAMCRHFETETTAICAEHVGSMLTEYGADPNKNWAAKDAAIHLMMGIAVKAESHVVGVTEVNTGVNVIDFFSNQILPELQDTNHASRPVVKATSIKFVSVFRNQFSRENFVALMPMLIGHLASPVIVVHTFAAYAIERILVTKVQFQGGGKAAKFGRAELKPFLEPLFTGLFAIIENQQWAENDYAMKCIMRALATAGEDAVPVTQIVLSKLGMVLERVAKNASNPQFNHNLFESIAVLVRSVCSQNPSMTQEMERLLFPSFQPILQNEIEAFTPYVFQILAQLLEFRPAGQPLGDAYSAVFAALLAPQLYNNKGNIPAIARLLHAYIQHTAAELTPHLNPILGVFQKLLAAKATEVSAFEILTPAIVHFPQEALEPSIVQIFTLLMTRLKQSNTPRYTQLVTNFFALFIGKFGPQTYFDPMNALQANLGVVVLDKFWADRLKTTPPVLRTEAKIQVVGVTKLLCENPALLSAPGGQEAWKKMLIGIVTLLTSDSFTRVATVAADEEPEIASGFDAAFSKLAYAKKEVEDPFPEIGDPRAMFVQSLHGVLAGSNGASLMSLVQLALSASDNPKLSNGLTTMFLNAGYQLG